MTKRMNKKTCERCGGIIYREKYMSYAEFAKRKKCPGCVSESEALRKTPVVVAGIEMSFDDACDLLSMKPCTLKWRLKNGKNLLDPIRSWGRTKGRRVGVGVNRDDEKKAPGEG